MDTEWCPPNNFQLVYKSHNAFFVTDLIYINHRIQSLKNPQLNAIDWGGPSCSPVVASWQIAQSHWLQLDAWRSYRIPIRMCFGHVFFFFLNSTVV